MEGCRRCYYAPFKRRPGAEANRVYFKQYLKAHPGVLLKITPVLPESNKQRRYLEGAIVPLVTFYQEGKDHRNSDDHASVREWLS